MADRDDLIFLARALEHGERYNDVFVTMKEVCTMAQELNEEERNLLSIGFINEATSRRKSLKVLKFFELEGNEEKVKQIRDLQDKVAKELSDLCTTFISLMDEHLIPSLTSAESKVYYKKMKGDCYRFLAAISHGSERHEYLGSSYNEYKDCVKEAKDLPISNPVRLASMLNHAVFRYEIMESANSAISFAEEAINESNAEVEKSGDPKALKLMELLKSNILLWSSADEDEFLKKNGSYEDSDVWKVLNFSGVLPLGQN